MAKIIKYKQTVLIVINKNKSEVQPFWHTNNFLLFLNHRNRFFNIMIRIIIIKIA